MENKTNKAYTYHFATGDETIEISDYWADILAALDKEEYNNDHRQLRDGRRCGTDLAEMEGKLIRDPFDLESAVQEECWLEYLKGKLTDKQTDVLTTLIESNGNTLKACAELGISRATLRYHRDLIQSKLYYDFKKEKVINNVGTGSNIRRLRKGAGIAGRMMADLIGVSSRKYFRIEKGESELTEEMASKIAVYFGIAVSEFVEYKKI